MSFDKEKTVAMERLRSYDHSIKGSVDKEISPLINLINKHPDYYTTSSCAGRIILFRESIKKNESAWIFSSHSAVKPWDLKSHLGEGNIPQDTLWLRMEPPILHISARDIDKASRLVRLANNNGFRRSSLISFSNRLVVEIFFPERLDCPVSEKGRMLADEGYVQAALKKANEKLKKSREKLKKFKKAFSLLSKQHNNHNDK